MAQTINLDDDFISADELELIQAKQIILEKLRVRFAEMPPTKEWGPQKQSAQAYSDSRAQPRCG